MGRGARGRSAVRSRRRPTRRASAPRTGGRGVEPPCLRQCNNLHGHGYRTGSRSRSGPDPDTGWVMDWRPQRRRRACRHVRPPNLNVDVPFLSGARGREHRRPDLGSARPGRFSCTPRARRRPRNRRNRVVSRAPGTPRESPHLERGRRAQGGSRGPRPRGARRRLRDVRRGARPRAKRVLPRADDAPPPARAAEGRQDLGRRRDAHRLREHRALLDPQADPPGFRVLGDQRGPEPGRRRHVLGPVACAFEGRCSGHRSRLPRYVRDAVAPWTGPAPSARRAPSSRGEGPSSGKETL